MVKKNSNVLKHKKYVQLEFDFFKNKPKKSQSAKFLDYKNIKKKYKDYFLKENYLSKEINNYILNKKFNLEEKSKNIKEEINKIMSISKKRKLTDIEKSYRTFFINIYRNIKKINNKVDYIKKAIKEIEELKITEAMEARINPSDAREIRESIIEMEEDVSKQKKIVINLLISVLSKYKFYEKNKINN